MTAMAKSKLTTARAKARQQAGSFIHAQRLNASIDDLLLARVVSYRDYLASNAEDWESESIGNFWQTVSDAGLVRHARGISFEGEKDPGENKYERPFLSPELDRRGRMAISATLWDCVAGGGLRLGVSSWSYRPYEALSQMITLRSPYMRAWWIGAFRDGESKEESLARAMASRYCRYYAAPTSQMPPNSL